MSSSRLIVSIEDVKYVLRNSYKNIKKNALTPFSDAMSSEKKLSDEKLAFMQFGICDYKAEP